MKSERRLCLEDQGSTPRLNNSKQLSTLEFGGITRSKNSEMLSGSKMRTLYFKSLM
ncbi:hypothetical protein Syncc8109_0486 [Synechococcus sp. WH 8109]|nr:hypothetical protein Syncc8109_0486 [Synechococcus sp. WH 8109]